MSISTGSRDTLPDCFRAVARARGDQPVLLGAGPTWTFAALDRASDGIAAGLAGRGVEPGDRIGLYCPNTPEFVVAYLGILKAGATVVPINLMLNPKEIAFILSDAGVKGFCYHQALAEAVEQARGLAPELGLSIRIGKGDGTDPALDALMATPGRPPTPTLDARHLAAILYTSGTTGGPRAPCSAIPICG